MATELTTPVNRAALTHQGITRLDFSVPHKRNATNDAAVLNKDKLKVRYEITSWDADGNVVSRAAREVPFATWTTGFKENMNSVYQLIVADAKANNLVGDGNDEEIN